MTAAAVDVNDLVGLPWRLGARGPHAYDCWGLVREILLRMRPGLPLPDWASDDMSRERQREIMRGAAQRWGVPTRELSHGTMLLSARAGHIAIVVDRWALTAQRRGGVVAPRVAIYAAQFGDLEAYWWRA